MTYWAAVEAKVERVAALIAAGEHEDGWLLGPQRICEEMADEAVDCAGWGRGLDKYPMTPEQQARIDRIIPKAKELYEEIQGLRATYDPD